MKLQLDNNTRKPVWIRYAHRQGNDAGYMLVVVSARANPKSRQIGSDEYFLLDKLPSGTRVKVRPDIGFSALRCELLANKDQTHLYSSLEVDQSVV